MEKILIIEDDKTISMGLSYYLTQEGFEVNDVHSVLETQKLLEKNLVIVVGMFLL